jgi:hypothetical protein
VIENLFSLNFVVCYFDVCIAALVLAVHHVDGTEAKVFFGWDDGVAVILLYFQATRK